MSGGFGYDFTVGVLTTAPIVWLTCLIPATYKKLSEKHQQELKPLREFFSVLLLIFGMLLGFLLSLGFVAQRYETDFIPYFLLCAFISIWLAKKYTAQPRLLSQIATAYFFFTGIMSMLTGFSFALTIYRWHWNAVLFSELSVMLYHLAPLTIGLTFMLIAYINRIASPSPRHH